jgi:hypothetical protein
MKGEIDHPVMVDVKNVALSKANDLVGFGIDNPGLGRLY